MHDDDGSCMVFTLKSFGLSPQESRLETLAAVVD